MTTAVPSLGHSETGDPDTGIPDKPVELSAIGQALAILGDRWVLLILQRAFLLHVRTFAGWRDELKISESVLSSRLKELVAHGVFSLAAYRNGRTRYEYRLTDRGLDLWSLLVAIYSWERDWTDRTDLPQLIHNGCGQEARAYLACGVCLEPMSARETRTVRGPLATFASVGLPRQHRRTVPTRTDYVGYCHHSMEILGDRWSTSVLAAAFLGSRRFGDFHAELGIAPSVLTDRLRRFVDSEVFSFSAGDYRLTERGLAFFEVFAFLVSWAQRELPAPAGSELTITHRSCGSGLAPVLRCTPCGEVLQRREVHFELDI
ncbi:winged helix-turn-helix transcriptional regulator [Acrocarpospora catenulata]|uniref:winged helix-turn-helix transcriptional regulator n=1 Tax=Acrocarpospora catenulata TaxID=2836182 RepID=UPI001BD97AD4|nr:helix-turn-helix domain-containing protein [Acrocarpospora catenulata]